MNTIYSFLSEYMNAIIVILGIVLFIFLVYNSMNLKGYQKQLQSILNWNSTTITLNMTTKEVEERTERERANPDTIREFQTNFSKACSMHDVFAQMIPLFPLFGILGTVSGLIGQLSAGDIDAVFSSLNVALGSTFWGLVFAIVLKFYDSVSPARRINDTQILLEDYDKKLNTAVMLGNISE